MVRKLFITPADIPAGVISRCLEIPASQEWLAVVNAAILLMTNPANYEQLNETDLTPDEAASAAYDLYVRYLEGNCGFMDCEDILQCIPDLEAAIIENGSINVNQIDASSTTIFEQRFPTTERETEILPLGIGCDKDVLFGSIREIVSRIDAYGQDFWEQVVSDADAIERIADLVALVPIFGDLLGETTLLLVDNADTLKNGYEAYQTIDLVDQITCALFELVCNDCRYPTYQEVFEYYASYGISGIEDFATLSWQLIVDYLIDTSGGSNQIIYYSTNLALLYARGLGATVLGQTGMEFVRTWALLGADSPSSDHETLCPCVVPPVHEYLIVDWYDNVDYLGAACAAGTSLAARYPAVQYICSLSLDDEVGASQDHSLVGLGSQQGDTNYRFDVNIPFGGRYHVENLRLRIRKQNNSTEVVRIKLFDSSTEVYDSGDIAQGSGTIYINIDRTGLDANATSMSVGTANAYRTYLDYIEVNRP